MSSSDEDSNPGWGIVGNYGSDDEAANPDFDSGFGGRRRKFTKEDHIYGIFNEDVEDEEIRRGADPMQLFAERKSAKRNTQMRFVSSGSYDLNHDKDQKKDDESGTSTKQSREDGDGDADTEMKDDGDNSEVAMTDAAEDLPTEEPGRRTFHVVKAKRKGGKSEDLPDELKAVQTKARVFDQDEDEDFGNFLQTSSKGKNVMKMMAKMGYKGGALGKTGKGMVNPLQVKVRKRGAGLGAAGDERTQQQVKLAEKGKEEAKKQEAILEEMQEDEVAYWKKGESRRPERRKKGPKYEIADPTAAPEAPQQVVIDMRGPQSRVVTDVGAALREKDQAYEIGMIARDTPLKELRHNMVVLLELANGELDKQKAIEKSEKKLNGECTENLEKLQGERTRASAQAERLSKIVRVLDDLQKTVASAGAQRRPSTDGNVDFEHLSDTVQLLRREYTEEFYAHDVYLALGPLSMPYIQAILQHWNVMTNPDLAHRVLTSWQLLLDVDDDHLTYGQTTDNTEIAKMEALYGSKEKRKSQYRKLFLQLIASSIEPAVEHALRHSWAPQKNSAEVANVLNVYDGLLPLSFFSRILERVVVPKLLVAVQDWNPLVDRRPLHEWFLPWLGVSGVDTSGIKPWNALCHRLLHTHNVYSIVRQKLSATLRNWSPTDASARMMFSAWRAVLHELGLDQTIKTGVAPKLDQAMEMLQIIPQQQDFQTVHSVLAWHELIAPDEIVNMFLRHFFPKFHAVLGQWLQYSGANFEEIATWYTTWKNIFQEYKLDGNTRVAAEFQKALLTMDSFMTHGTVTAPEQSAPAAAPRAAPATLPSVLRTHLQARSQPVAATAAVDAGDERISVKEAVAELAEQHGVMFVPRVGMVYNGHQIYGFGSVPVVFDARGIVLAQRPGGSGFAPVRLSDLLAMAGVPAP